MLKVAAQCLKLDGEEKTNTKRQIHKYKDKDNVKYTNTLWPIIIFNVWCSKKNLVFKEKFGINCASAEAQFGTGRGIIFQIIQILNSDPASSYFPLNTPTCNLVRTYHHSPRSKNVNFPKLAQNNVGFFVLPNTTIYRAILQ